MEEKLDRRVRKTRTALRKALVELLSQKPVQEISVRELSELCDINRGTFYIHYRDIYDMLEKVEAEMRAEFTKTVANLSLENAKRNIRDMLLPVFEFLHKNADMAGALLGPNGDINYTNQVKSLVTERMAALKGIAAADGMEAKVNTYRSAFIVSGCIGLIEHWMSGGAVEPPDQMAAQAEELIQHCLQDSEE